MKKKIISSIVAGLLISLIPITAFAGTWIRNGSHYWKYLEENGNYARDEWIYDNGSWYFLKSDGNMAAGGALYGEYYNLGGYAYYFDASGKMASGGFADKISYDGNIYTRYFADKDGHLVNGLFMVDGVLYEAFKDNFIINNERSYKRTIGIYKSNGKQILIDGINDHGKILDPDGKPFAANSEIYTNIKYLPKYDSKGNLIGEIRN